MEAYKCNACGKLLRLQNEDHLCKGSPSKITLGEAEYCANFGHDEVESISANGKKSHYAEKIPVSEIEDKYIYLIGYEVDINCRRCKKFLGGKWRTKKTSSMPPTFSWPTELTNNTFEMLTGLKVTSN